MLMLLFSPLLNWVTRSILTQPPLYVSLNTLATRVIRNFKGSSGISCEMNCSRRKKPQPASSAEAAEEALSELAHALDLTRRSFPIDDAEALIPR